MIFKELTDRIIWFAPEAKEIDPKIVELMYLATGLTGEAGEFANLVKKLARGDSYKKIVRKILDAKGITETCENWSNEELEAIILGALKEEIAGTFIYLELICRSLELELAEVVLEEVKEVEKKMIEE